MILPAIYTYFTHDWNRISILTNAATNGLKVEVQNVGFVINQSLATLATPITRDTHGTTKVVLSCLGTI